MEYHICRTTEDADSRFIVYDSTDVKKYTVTGKFGVLGDILRIKDTDGNNIFKIQQTSMPLPITVYSLSGCGERARLMYNHVKKKFSFIGEGWFVTGLAPVFKVIDADNSTVMIQDVTSNSDRLLTINYEHRQILCLAIAVCINSIELSPSVSAQPV